MAVGENSSFLSFLLAFMGVVLLFQNDEDSSGQASNAAAADYNKSP